MTEDRDFKINMRFDRWTWTLFGRYAGWRYRTAVIAEFIDWYVGLSDEIPERPTVEELMAEERDPTKGHMVGNFNINDDETPTVRTAAASRALDEDDHHIRIKGKPTTTPNKTAKKRKK